MQFLQRAMGGQQVWVRRLEHGVLRVVSLGFSMASAHAIRWFFAPLDGVDALQPAITWMIALGFGLLGYFVSRGLAHRLMNRERIRALVLCNASARSAWAPDYEIGFDAATLESIAEAFATQWGTGFSIDMWGPSIAAEPPSKEEVERVKSRITTGMEQVMANSSDLNRSL